MKPPAEARQDQRPASRPLIIHNSNSEVGGAEASLIASVAECGFKPLFLVPAEGGLSRAVAARGWEWIALPWPPGLAGLTQSRWFALPLILPGLIPYLFRLGRAFLGAKRIWSSGVKSHAACLLLSPYLGSRLVFDVRDFLRPPALRKAIALASEWCGCGVTANSGTVAADFPTAQVRYPKVSLARAPEDRRAQEGKRIISHLAYFAPYKGQDLFLQCARKLLDAGVDAEFWVIGDVIYPAASYARYRQGLYALAAKLRLDSHVRFLGRVEGGHNVQMLLERTHLLVHCTREPEPFGRAVMEALLCGCEAICHKDSGVVEVTEAGTVYPNWMAPLRAVLGPDYVRVRLRDS
ncbi:MAG: glycosyltransferase [Fibrobacteria bacterium]